MTTDITKRYAITNLAQMQKAINSINESIKQKISYYKNMHKISVNRKIHATIARQHLDKKTLQIKHNKELTKIKENENRFLNNKLASINKSTESKTLRNLKGKISSMRDSRKKKNNIESSKTFANIPNNVVVKIISTLPSPQSKAKIKMVSKRLSALEKGANVLKRKNNKKAAFHVIDTKKVPANLISTQSNEHPKHFKWPVQWTWYMDNTNKAINPGDIVWFQNSTKSEEEFGKVIFMVNDDKSLHFIPYWFEYDNYNQNILRNGLNIDYTEVLKKLKNEVFYNNNLII